MLAPRERRYPRQKCLGRRKLVRRYLHVISTRPAEISLLVVRAAGIGAGHRLHTPATIDASCVVNRAVSPLRDDHRGVVTPWQGLRHATLRLAEKMGVERDLSSLELDKRADFVAPTATH